MIDSPYFTEFPISFPLNRLARAVPGNRVLDPFCGGGATLFAARLCGLPSIGTDTNPAAAAIAASKLFAVSGDRLVRRAEGILRKARISPELPKGAFWTRCYTPEILRDLCVFRAYFQSARMDPCDNVLRGMLLGLLHGPLKPGPPAYLSNDLPASFVPPPQHALRHWRGQGLAAPEIRLMECLRRRVAISPGEMPPAGRGHVFLAEARNLPALAGTRRFDWVITSPPYYGRDLFRACQWLRNWFLGYAPFPQAPGSHTRPRNPKQHVQFLAETWRAVDQLCRPNAQIVLRLGAVPGIPGPAPETLLMESTHCSRVCWRLIDRCPVKDPRDTSLPRSPFPYPTSRPTNEEEYTFIASPKQSRKKEKGEFTRYCMSSPR